MRNAQINFEPIPELDGAPGALILEADSLPPYRDPETVSAIAKMKVYALATGAYSMILFFEYSHHRNENRQHVYAIDTTGELIAAIFNAKTLSARVNLQLVNWRGLAYVSAPAPVAAAASDDEGLVEE